MRVNRENLHYFLIRIGTYPLSFLSFRSLHLLGKIIGFFAFFLMREYRKRALSNLALASDLKLSNKELRAIAIESFQNLAINCLEYPKFGRKKDISKVVRCINPEIATKLHEEGQGIIFFCGHLSNWEVLFLDGTTRMKGVAIGKSIKNKKLYQWIVSIREKFGGKIISPQNAVREGFRSLKKGQFLGIVGDQGMPDSGYSFPFLGRRAWTSTAPALLAYKSKCPVIFAETHRLKGKYEIRYSEPIWPKLDLPLDRAVEELMDRLLSLMQESIKKNPGEWLWQHNRWKQQTLKTLYKRFRQDCICIILPEEQSRLSSLLPHLETLKSIYASDFITVISPKALKGKIPISSDEVFYYDREIETKKEDFRFKLIFDFAEYPETHKHYEKFSAFEVLTMNSLKELAKQHLTQDIEENPSEIFKRALCRPGSVWKE